MSSSPARFPEKGPFLSKQWSSGSLMRGLSFLNDQKEKEKLEYGDILAVPKLPIYIYMFFCFSFFWPFPNLQPFSPTHCQGCQGASGEVEEWELSCPRDTCSWWEDTFPSSKPWVSSMCFSWYTPEIGNTTRQKSKVWQGLISLKNTWNLVYF